MTFEFPNFNIKPWQPKPTPSSEALLIEELQRLRTENEFLRNQIQGKIYDV
jgi:hypothetical protein